MNKLNLTAIVLAAGQGKRMKSQTSKVLHKIAGKPMLLRTVKTLENLNPKQIIVVANPKNRSGLKRLLPENVVFALQQKPLGTADAAKAGLKMASNDTNHIAILYGDDTAFYKPQTVLDVYKKHIDSEADVTFVTIKLNNPIGLGRIVRKNGQIAIVEEKDASADQEKIKEVNDGLYIFKRNFLSRNLPKITPSVVTGELYITDLIELANKAKRKINTVLIDKDQWHGINTQIELAKANFKHSKQVHIMGMSGAGTSAIAGIAEAYGFKVSGCDKNPKSSYSANSAFQIAKGHNQAHIQKNLSCLIVSPAIMLADPKNKEIAKAKKKGLPVLTWQEFQGQILQENRFTIAVAGAYGKSTTTAMISDILIEAGLDPTCEVGAKVIAWKQNFQAGRSKYYVCEADEYNDNFLNYESDIAIILNTAWDHPDYFKNQQAVVNSYKKFISNIKPGGTLVIGSDPKLNQLADLFKKKSDPQKVKIVKIRNHGSLNLSIIGKFRRENANAALTVADTLHMPLSKAKKAVEKFSGLGRRLEYKGDINGVKFYDDYAVQPYTIETTANALIEKYVNKRVLLVLELHMPSRVNKFFNKFVEAIKNIKVDRVLITNIFLAREKGNKELLSKKLSSSVNKALYTGSIPDTAAYVKKNIADFDVVCTMGAGDAYKIYELVKKNETS